MNTFSNIKELLSTLAREHKLLTEMFEKRKTLSYKYEYALEMVDNKEDRLRYLIAHSIIRENKNFLEIDDQYLLFFEQILEVNEEINIASINANIQNVKENILYYLKENNEARQYEYLRKIKNTFRKIGNITLRNVIDLKRNSDVTFKNEPNYKVKKAKLENLDLKRIDINTLIEQTYNLVSEEEQTFFKSALDYELDQVITLIKLQLNECRHNLIEIQKQIIEYLNQIKYQGGVIEKIRQIKYLKDQFTIRTDTDLDSIIIKNNDLIFEANPAYPLKLSLAFLQINSEVHSSIIKIAKRIKTSAKINIPLAGVIPIEYLQDNIEEDIQINLEEIQNSFLATGNNLFDFVMHYDFERDLTFDQKVTLYCQIISQYEKSLNVTENYNTQNEIVYAMVYPK